jgi:hypothetical protein
MNDTSGAENAAPDRLKSFEDLVAFLERQSIQHRLIRLLINGDALLKMNDSY